MCSHQQQYMHVGIIGAGAGACATAYVLSNTTDAEITLLEKSGGVCGRAATRRRDEITYDYGANYVKSKDKRVTELLTEQLDTAGLGEITDPIWVFDNDGETAPGRESGPKRLTYEQGLTQIGKRLLAETDATVHRRTRIVSLAKSDTGWTATDAERTDWGPFDLLVVTPPAPQTTTLLENTDWESETRAELISLIDGVDYRTIWTAVLGYQFQLDRPYYGLVNPGKDHEIGWISREECKPGHVPDGQSVLIVQANHEWSQRRYDDDPAANVRALAEMTAEIIDDQRLTEPAWTDHQGWRYALPEGGAPMGLLRSAEYDGLYFTGDWVAGEGRIHAALANGLETAERMVRTYW